MEKFQGKLTKIIGDASFRQFYRLKKDSKTTIIVKTKKDKYKNLVAYSAINKFLKKNNILAPQTKFYNINKGIIEIDDFGDISFSKYIGKKNKYNSYKKLVKLLLKIQKIKIKKKINLFSTYKVKLDFYNKKNLHKESDLFFDWYLLSMIGKRQTKKYKKIIKRELNKIYDKIYFKNNYFVHRDFHAANFMIFKGRIGVIDTQDAIIGNPSYDLASLVDDVRIKTSFKFKEKLFNFYLSNAPKELKAKSKEFKNDFDILSVQRSLKILGIFYRLYKRDKKKKYLKFMPYTWKLIEIRLKNSLLKNLKLLLDEVVAKKERKKVIFK